jgi:LysM repeat protein
MEKPPSLSETQPRTCPNCGASVSSRARTCLICGANLTTPVAPVAPTLEGQAPRRRFPWLIVGVAAGLVALALIGGGIFLRSRAAAFVTPTATYTPAATATETRPPTETPTPAPPTTTPTASASPTAPPTAVPPTKYTVRLGDTLADIADRYNTTIEKIQQFNNLNDSDVIQAGQMLLIPVAGSTPNPTTTPKPTETFVPGPTPGTILHVVQSGDTLLGISLKYGVPMGIIQKANDIQDAESIRAGQQLVIPIGPTGTPTAGPQATPTGLPTYPAPVLLAPLNDLAFEGADNRVLLQWASVGILRQNEFYQVQLEQLGTSNPPTLWRTQATGWHVPVEMFPKADDTHRTFRWQVGVVRETGTQADGTRIFSEAGLLSAARTFRWLIARPTPTPTPGPSQ